jgi:hypothetical protein
MVLRFISTSPTARPNSAGRRAPGELNAAGVDVTAMLVEMGNSPMSRSTE